MLLASKCELGMLIRCVLAVIRQPLLLAVLGNQWRRKERKETWKLPTKVALEKPS